MTADIDLRPVTEPDLATFRRFAVEPGLIGLDWAGFRDAREPARQFAANGFLGPDGGRLMVDVGGDAAGFVSWHRGAYMPDSWYWEIGIALLPEWRGRGIGWRAQAMLCDYLFHHTPVQRIQAGTHPGEPGRAAVAGEGRVPVGRRGQSGRVPCRAVAGRSVVQPVAGRSRESTPDSLARASPVPHSHAITAPGDPGDSSELVRGFQRVRSPALT